jgi:mannose-6-phosphate isomerase-like protein (cupin superfamily)
MLNGKVWGKTKELLVNPFVELHDIWINPHTCCSLHSHQYKSNLFYIISGTLEIHVHKNDYDLVDVTVLSAGDWTTVSPNEYHKFVNNSDDIVHALEIYYPQPIQSDILRKDTGKQLD